MSPDSLVRFRVSGLGFSDEAYSCRGFRVRVQGLRFGLEGLAKGPAIRI